MSAFTRNSILTLCAVATLALTSATADAAKQKSLYIYPGHNHGHCHSGLPKFGFSSRTIYGLGEEVVQVRWNGLAAEIGLEPGDLILALNGMELTYHGAWNDALRHAVTYNEPIELRIRDVRTGSIVLRTVYLGGSTGPITPKSHVVNHYYSAPPAGPITLKSQKNFNNFNNQKFKQQQFANGVKQIVKLFDKD